MRPIILLGMIIAVALTTNAQTNKEIEQKILSLEEKINALQKEKTLLEISLANKNLTKYETTISYYSFSCNKCMYEKVCFGISDSLSYVTLTMTNEKGKITKSIKEYKGEIIEIPQCEGSQFITLIAPDEKEVKPKKTFEL